MNFETLKLLVLAVEENNEINDAKWSNWESALHIASVYEEKIDNDVEAVLNRAIETNGFSLSLDLKLAEQNEEGINFGGNWVERIWEKNCDRRYSIAGELIEKNRDALTKGMLHEKNTGDRVRLESAMGAVKSELQALTHSDPETARDDFEVAYEDFKI